MRYVFEIPGYTLNDVFDSESILYDYHEFDSHYVESEDPNISFTSSVDFSDVDRLSIVDFDEDNEEEYAFEEMYVLQSLGNNRFEFYLLGLDVLFQGDYDSTIKPDGYRGHFTFFENSYSNLKLLKGFKEIRRD